MTGRRANRRYKASAWPQRLEAHRCPAARQRAGVRAAAARRDGGRESRQQSRRPAITPAPASRAASRWPTTFRCTRRRRVCIAAGISRWTGPARRLAGTGKQPRHWPAPGVRSPSTRDAEGQRRRRGGRGQRRGGQRPAACRHTQEGLLAAAAELTVSVARVGDLDGLKPVMARLAEHLDAVGLIVWLEDASTQRLTPIVTHGYPAETLAHLPAIDLDADNATARAWRLAELQIVAGRGAQPGAIVVPMPSSAGCVGVIAAEVRHGREHDPATLSLARILAAQLAMLTGSRG